jgi:hypothetical protein
MMMLIGHRILMCCISAIYIVIPDVNPVISVWHSNYTGPVAAFTLSKFYKRFLPVRINEFLPSPGTPPREG